MNESLELTSEIRKGLTRLGTFGCEEVVLDGCEGGEEREGALGFLANRFDPEGRRKGEAIASIPK